MCACKDEACTRDVDKEWSDLLSKNTMHWIHNSPKGKREAMMKKKYTCMNRFDK